ncbi:MAG: hypothetical protein E7D71_09525 [Varibaculum cambriense]|nr:hypothetical protein [Varibaculum cambriense]
MLSSIALIDTPKFNIGLDNDSILSFTSLIGIANPIPSAPSLAFNVLIPITCPFVLINGPPLFPELIAVSVCIKLVLTPVCVSTLLFNALTIPLVNVDDNSLDNGFPIANTSSPGCNASESPNSTTQGTSISSLIFIIATS